MTDLTKKTIHATAVAIAGKAALIIGPSGSGKSSLALQLIGFGASLVADDQCDLFVVGGSVTVRRPPTLPNAIEARGIGLLRAPMSESAIVSVVVNMERLAADRFPDNQTVEILGQHLAKIDKSDAAHFPSAVLLYLTHGIAT